LAASLVPAAAQQPTNNPTPQSNTAAKPTPTPAPQPPVAIRPMASDLKAYTDATRIKDPQKKIEALEKFIDQFPESFYISNAHVDSLDALIKSQPQNKEKILVQADRAIQRSQSPSSSGITAYNIASKLMKAGMLSEAEQFAQKSVTSTDEYISQMVKDIQKQ